MALYNNRRKQRRQAAAGVVQSLWGHPNPHQTNSGRKSTAQPRPVIHVPAGGIGPIAEPNENDVLCGRGGRINSHSGNVKFRDVIQTRKKEYLAPTTKKLEKAHIAASIVNDIRSMQPPGRFLKEDGKTGMWFDIGDAKAIKKTGQALREDAPDIRPEIEDGGSSGDEKKSSPEDKSDKRVSTPTPTPTTSSSSGSKPRKSESPPVSSPTAAQPSSNYDPHGPQLLPGATAWPDSTNGNVDHQGRAAMPPPFENSNNSRSQQRANPYMPTPPPPPPVPRDSFEPRIVPIKAPTYQDTNSNRMPPSNQFFSGNSVGPRTPKTSKHAQEVLSYSQKQQRLQQQQQYEEQAFGRPFHPPASAVGSSQTMSSISGLTDPAPSAMSGSGFGGSYHHHRHVFAPPMPAPNHHVHRYPSGGGGGGVRFQQVPQQPVEFASDNNTLPSRSDMSYRTSDMMSIRSGDISSYNGSLVKSASFPDMSSIDDVGGGGGDDEDMVAIRSILSSGNSRASFRTSGMSMMSIGSGTSSGHWMNGSLDANSVFSEMSSDMNALDLAS
eukprot:scaffold8206_cov135-Cylindrotheca_fusiformis.AAC.2